MVLKYSNHSIWTPCHFVWDPGTFEWAISTALSRKRWQHSEAEGKQNTCSNRTGQNLVLLSKVGILSTSWKFSGFGVKVYISIHIYIYIWLYMYISHPHRLWLIYGWNNHLKKKGRTSPNAAWLASVASSSSTKRTKAKGRGLAAGDARDKPSGKPWGNRGKTRGKSGKTRGKSGKTREN